MCFVCFVILNHGKSFSFPSYMGAGKSLPDPVGDTRDNSFVLEMNVWHACCIMSASENWNGKRTDNHHPSSLHRLKVVRQFRQSYLIHGVDAMKLTKKAKLERFDSLQQEHDLLERFFWDTCEGMRPHTTASYVTKDKDRFSAAVYGVERGDGGYIVIKSMPAGTPSITYWDEWQAKVRELPFVGEWSLAMKSLAEQLRRNLPAHSCVYPKPEQELPRAW